MAAKSPRAPRTTTWEKAGDLIIDSGQLLVCDAGITRGARRASNQILESYSSAVLRATMFYVEHHRPAKHGEIEPSAHIAPTTSGVVMTNFGGDGTYPIYVRRDPKSRMIRAVLIDLDETLKPEAR